jgi:hypothetical protein
MYAMAIRGIVLVSLLVLLAITTTVEFIPDFLRYVKMRPVKIRTTDRLQVRL